jgi:DNA-binding PadR family transcriptional regulator
MPSRRTATTANAILGLLALRPSWTTWELRNQLRRNMRFFWPRAESRILAELKRLANDGLAEAQREMVGRRPRTTYKITRQGRSELRDWLATPPRATTLESEPLLRVLLGQLGTRDQLAKAIDQVETDANTLIEIAHTVADEYLAGTAPFQDHVDHRAFVFDYLATHADGMRSWAERTRKVVAGWPDMNDIERRDQALALIEKRRAVLGKT